VAAVACELVKSLDQEFMNVCLLPGALQTRFQPIVDLQLGKPSLWALECLTRGPEGSQYESAEVLFCQARRLNLEPEIDRACIATALETASAAMLPHPLFINVHPATLERDRGFGKFLLSTARRCGITMDRITVEVVERGRNSVDDALLSGLAALRAIGARIALDDFGTGIADHVVLRDCAPDYLKIDGALFRAARRSRAERQLLDSVVRTCAARGAAAIAEGIEDVWDLDMAIAGGITLAQGFFLGRPQPAAAIAGRWPGERVAQS
jgi:EAL domain-containing protein (putative c-di-GMP-specific phosphodiesterase class I)